MCCTDSPEGITWQTVALLEAPLVDYNMLWKLTRGPEHKGFKRVSSQYNSYSHLVHGNESPENKGTAWGHTVILAVCSTLLSTKQWQLLSYVLQVSWPPAPVFSSGVRVFLSPKMPWSSVDFSEWTNCATEDGRSSEPLLLYSKRVD